MKKFSCAVTLRGIIAYSLPYGIVLLVICIFSGIRYSYPLLFLLGALLFAAVPLCVGIWGRRSYYTLENNVLSYYRFGTKKVFSVKLSSVGKAEKRPCLHGLNAGGTDIVLTEKISGGELSVSVKDPDSFLAFLA